MQLFKKTLGLIAILSICPAAFAATSRGDAAARVGVTGAASRMPKIVTTVSTGTKATTATGATTTAAALLANSECIDSYTDCIKGDDACGENFEECTTRVLFHGKMPTCLSTLAQCSSAGVESLFGTSVVSALSNVASKNTYGEITDYTYPTDGSVLGQMITAAAISNRYDTSTCVRRYTSCLKKDSVCGNDFELCTTDKEFKKQRVFCDSTLARCQSEGLVELMGANATLTSAPTAASRIGEMITEGAALAAVNAVSTCYKVVDQCILGACADNPYKCTPDVNRDVANIVQQITDGTLAVSDVSNDLISKTDVASYIKNSCLETIGTSKYCYATFIGNGKMPTNAQLRDEDNQEEIYDAAYAARMNAGMNAKIADLVDKFDTRAKQNCTETVKSCAMRVCGGGSGAACYSAVFGTNGTKSINAGTSYDDIKSGCAAIVNTDLNCKYAAKNTNGTGTYSYSYIDKEAFDVLFPAYNNGTENDVIGVVAALNASLATSYNDAAIANMKKQCQAVATSCVKSMCGTDYVNCYRNRTDVYSGLTNTGEATFDKSMNKVGGVLDYTVVLGLCLDTVKNASACEEHLAIERNNMAANATSTESWGANTSVRGGWIDAGSSTAIAGEDAIYATDEYGNRLCRNAAGVQGVCNNVDANGTIYDTPIVIGYETYIQSKAAESLFKDLIYDIEKEAQAKYNAKLTREQNMCLSSNNGGIVGNNENGSTFMWAKLKSNKVPKDYTINGLENKDFTASNDLYGSFCRVRITLQSDDKTIQEAMKGKNWTTAYFATGDSFTCGSWIPASALESIANKVAEDKAGSINDAAHKRTQFWTTLLGAAGGGVGGYFLGEGIRNGNVFSGLTGLNGTQTTQKTTQQKQGAKNCVDAIREYKSSVEQGASEKTQINNAKTVVLNADTAGVYPTWTEAIKQVLNSEEYTESGMAIALAKMEYEFNALNNQCNGILSNDNIPDKETETRTRWGITAATTGVTALASGLLVYKATRDMQQTLLDDEQKAAYEEFMNSVGRHISCYIGGDEAGSYGDVITTSIE